MMRRVNTLTTNHFGIGLAACLVPLFLALLPACATQAPAPPPTAPTFDSYVREAGVAMSHGDFAQAIQQLQQAIALRPDSARAYNYLGMAYQQRKEYDQAKASFEKAVSLEPNFAPACNNLGSLYWLNGDYDHAAELFKKAISLAPDLVSAHYNLGNTLLALGRTEEAMPHLLEAFKLDPNFLDSGSTLVSTAHSKNLGGPEVAFLYAKLFASTGNVDKTVQYLEKAREEGFRDWRRIATEKEFDSVRNDLRVQAFLKP